MTILQITRRLEKLKLKQAKLRDELRELESWCTDMADSADDALESLSCAIDRLSELV